MSGCIGTISQFLKNHPNTTNAVSAIILSVVASGVYERAVAFWKSKELRSRFEPLAGTYKEYSRVAAGHLDSTGGTITLTYLGGRRFKTVAIMANRKPLWHGEIVMHDDTTVTGSGFYSHMDRDDTGIHRVIFNPDKKHFNVSGDNTSHPEGVKDFKTVWERTSD